ncbi:MAG: histidine phosphatase family protein [Bacteroidota bacterium]
MKQILLLRHAKSSWDDPGLEDFNRPLAGRGLTDAPRMGKFIRKAGYKPDYIASSSATRAKQTTELVLEAAHVSHQMITWDNDLYFGSVNDYLNAIQQAPNQAETIMIVGHNPLMETVAGWLSGASERTAIRMPTAALVCLESFSVRWTDITPGTCQIKWMMIPKLLKEIF